MTLLHGSCVAIGEQGVLIRGASGSGKSDLALRLIDGGGELVADDYVEIGVEEAGLVARAPDPLAGLLEVRGLGLMRLPYRPCAPVALGVELIEHTQMERMPKPCRMEVAGVAVPSIRLWAFEASAAAKIRLYLNGVLCVEGDSAIHQV